MEEEMEERPWLKHYDDGVPKTIEYPKITLFDLPKIPEFNLYDFQGGQD
jgi:hypothetical protein